jgi:hypothetical protein
MKASQDAADAKVARRERDTDAMETVEAVAKAVNEAEAASKALRVGQASEELACAELESLCSEAARACESLWWSRTPLTSWLGEILSRVERAVANGAYFGARIVLSMVISHYDGIDLLSIGQGFVVSLSDEDIETLIL